MGCVDFYDNAAKNEAEVAKTSLRLSTPKHRGVYDRVRSTGSQRPRMYGLLKTHKEHIPLRPILSMIGSSQHELAK